eukprot:TRINITY_DN1805_c0_g1_i1.p1 TRINITY_DN1805_c0_g1~~TRINITY_DN1805_c0_g1_i1.p1  ORF type:complete len:342 (+),score=65.92 TRINITY_DN1805_c0_g1_i1:116-1141(+)
MSAPVADDAGSGGTGGVQQNPGTTPLKRVGDYELLEVIGRGSFSEVRRACHAETRDVVAMKIICKQLLMEQSLVSQLQREVAILKSIKHPNVVNLIQVLRTRSNIYLVLELVDGGDLDHLIRDRGALPSEEARRFFREFIAGLAFVHKHGVAHRDLKLENLLIASDGRLKISDFGLARAGAATRDLGGLESDAKDFVTRCGTPNYVAPEVLTEPHYNGFKVDVWSAGVILFVLLSGRLPFPAKNIADLYRKIQLCDYQMSSRIPPGAADLLQHIIVADPEKRATMRDIISHPWFQEGLSDTQRTEYEAILTEKPNLEAPIATLTPQGQTQALPPVAPKITR